MVSAYGYYKEILQCIKEDKPLPIYRINEIGSRMSSKTWSSIDFIIWASLLAPVKTDAFRHFKGKDRTELYDQFKKQIDHMGLADVIEEHKTNMTLTFPNGSIIEVQGLHSPTQKGEVKLTGKSASTKFKYHISLAEERYEITDQSWSAVLQAIRGSSQFMEIHLANPWVLSNNYVSYVNEHLPFNLQELIDKGQQFKVVDKEVELLGGEVFKYKELFHITNYQINEHLTMIDKVKLELGAKQDPHRANTILYGFYGTPEGAIWKWVQPKMKQKPKNPSTSYIGGVDYGERKDATTAYIAGFSDGFKSVHIEHEYYWANKNGRVNKNTNDLAMDVVNHYMDFYDDNALQGNLDIWVDGSAIPFITALNTYCEDMGWDDVLHFYQQTDKKRVADRIETMKTIASYGMLTIDESCAELRREINEQVYADVSRTSIDYVSGDDHGTDAMYYAIAPKWIELLENMDYILEKLAEEEIANRQKEDE